MAVKLERYIKTSTGEKVEQVVTSLNIEKRQLEFLKARNLNLSKLVRDFLDQLILESK